MSNFSAACNRLSIYVKDQQRLAAARPTTTMSLLPGLQLPNESKQIVNIEVPDLQPMDLFPQHAGLGDAPVTTAEKTPLTIFYGGKMLVFNDFPAEKAKDLMLMAENVEKAKDTPTLASVVPAAAGPRTPGSLRRRACLDKFMEKRRERIHSAKAPYSVTKPVDSSKPQLPWFLLGSEVSKQQ